MLSGDEAHQVQFDFFGGTVFGESQTAGKPLHMRVNDNAFGRAECVPEDDVGRFASDAWQFGERLEGAGHLAGVEFQKSHCALFEVACLRPEKPGRLYQRLEFLLGDGGVVLSIAAADKEAAGDLVDTHVGALGRKDGGHQQFERVGEIQFAVGVRIGPGEDFEQFSGTFGKGGAGHAGQYRRRTGRRNKAGEGFCFGPGLSGRR